jgi:hypothetical protein
LVLVRTLRAAHPDWHICAVLVDKPPPGIEMQDALAAFDTVVEADMLGIPRFESWIFKHNIIEACTAVKGRMMQHLLAEGWEKIVYLDPDIAVFHPLTHVLTALDTHSIILTPHQVEANTDALAIKDNEMTAYLYGIYNLGFCAIRNDANGHAFADWWAGMLYRACYEEVERGLYTDQKYCDIVPALFEGVLIDRDPGCNVASWNLSRRTLDLGADGNIRVNGSLLKFYHFTKIEGVGDVMTRRYGGSNLDVYEVWSWYKRELARNAVSGLPKRYWHYGQFFNGCVIPEAARILYRERADLMTAFDNPFDVEGFSFFGWLKAEAGNILIETVAGRA